MNMMRRWWRRYFSDPQVVILAALLVAGVILVSTVGDILAPVLAAVVIAYLLEGLVKILQRWGVPRMLAVVLVFSLFLLASLGAILGIVPLLTRQATQLFQEVPKIMEHGQEMMLRLPEKYPHLVSQAQVTELVGRLRDELTQLGKVVLSQSVASVVSIIAFTVYLVLLPLLVFFFLKDKDRILTWFRQFLPSQRQLALSVWREVDLQLGNFIRGKFWEVLIVWAATYIVFVLMGLQFAMLLSLLVGLSVVVPYVGAVVVTFPIAAIAFFQWGLTADFVYLMVGYLIVQGLDGNLLVPLLFSEVVNLHPIAIIVSVLFFGGIWGFWGVFFAIPLATVVQAVLRAWPVATGQAAGGEGTEGG
ncbi:MAG: AI-2E family transporter [Gammaproteobacteria bacterium]|jgi:putative permease